MKLVHSLPLLLTGLIALSACSANTDTESVDVKEEEVVETSASTTNTKTETKSDTSKSDETTESQSEQIENQFFDVDFGDISFALPESVVPIDVGEQPLPVLAVYLNQMTRTNLNVVAEPLAEPVSLDEYIENVIAQSGVEFVSNETYQSNGFAWNETIRFIENEMGEIHLIQRTIIHNNTAYIFSYSGSPDVIENDFELFNYICASVTTIQ